MPKCFKYTDENLFAGEFCRILGISTGSFFHYRTKCGLRGIHLSTVAAAKSWVKKYKATPKPGKRNPVAAKPAKTQPSAAVLPPGVPPALDFPPDELRYQNYQNLVGAMIECTFDEIRQTHVPGRIGWPHHREGPYAAWNYTYSQQVEFFKDGGTLDLLVGMSGLQIQPAKFKEKGRRMIEAVRLGKPSLD